MATQPIRRTYKIRETSTFSVISHADLIVSGDADLLVIKQLQTDEAVRLTPPVKLTLESAVEFIDDDELVEITPLSIRVRKRYLTEIERKRSSHS